MEQLSTQETDAYMNGRTALYETYSRQKLSQRLWEFTYVHINIKNCPGVHAYDYKYERVAAVKGQTE
jgi:hypothetical protein